MFDDKNLHEDLADFFHELIRRLAPGIYTTISKSLISMC
jgi:hypothetical protein